MPQDIRFYDDGKGNVRQVAADKIDRFKSLFPDAKEADENQLSEIENKRANDNEQQRLESSDINVSVPTVEKVDLTLSDNQNPFSRKGMKGAIDISNAHHRSDPDVQFRAKYEAYKDNPELHRDEDAPEMVERRKKQPWYSYIGGGNAVVNAIKQNQYGEENQEGATKTRQSQDYLETRTNKADKHKEADFLSDFLTNTQSGRDAVEYDKKLDTYFEQLKPKLEQQITDLENEITRKSTERRKLLERGVPGTRFGVKQSWLSGEDKEKIKQAKQKDTEEADKIATANDLQEATNSLREMKMMRDAVNDRDANAFKQFFNEFGRRMPQALFDIGTLGVKEIFDEAAPQGTGRLTGKADDLFANYQHAISNLYEHETSMAQDIANGGLHTLGFMAQMAATGGIATGIAAGATKGVGKALLKEGTRKFVAKNTAKGVGKVVKIAGKNISEAFVQTVLMPSTLAGALEKNAEQPGSFLNAYATNFIAAFGEVGLERVGDFLPGPKFKTPFMKKVTELTHMNSFPGEMLEENLQTAWNALFQTGEGEWADLVDPRNQLVTAGTIGLMQLPGGVIETGGYAAGKHRIAAQKRSIKKGYQQNVSNMNKVFGDDTQEILASLDETLNTIEDSSEAMLRLVESVTKMGETLDEKQQDAVVNYGLSFIAMKGVEKAKQEAKESAKQANAETLKGYVNESTGTITLVNVAGMDAPVAVQGDIVFTEDGKIDTHQSGVLYYVDSEGKTQVVNPQFVDLVESTPANQIEEALNQTSEQEIENEYANDEVRAYEAGEVIRYAVNEQQSIVGTIQGVDNNGNYIVYVDGFGEATIEPRMIVPEDNLKGVQNGTMVEYTNDKGEIVVGEVQDMISLRNAGLVMIDGQEVPTQNIIGIEGTTEAENATIKEEATQQEDKETEVTPVTPEQQAEQEKETFIQSLPVNNKGEIDQKQMTTAQTMQYFEYQYGVDETLKAAEQQIKNKEGQLKAAQTRLNSDPFNIAKREKVSEIQSELEEYKAYVFDKKKAKAQEIADTSTSSIAEEQAKQERERAEAEAQRQAEQADIEALKGIPDVTVDKAKDARARGYRSVNGERVNRQEASTPTTFTEAQRKFSDKESVPVKRTIVEAETLQPSHKNGVKNDNFFITEAQPKPRTDDASQHAAESIASNINPQEITGGVTAYTGAPIVNNHGEVIQGNNRVTGLQLMHESRKEQAEKYKEYLRENAADYGMTAEQVDAMTNPVAVDVAEVSDADAIRLGQLAQQDTESGGIQRVPAKQTSVALGENMGRFAQILFESTNEDAISTVIEKNGRKAIDYLRQKGVINPTQYQSAFDKDGNITPEAKKDLQDIASQMLFEGANENIEQMFDALPDKAQKAILQTIHRDAKSPKSERIVKELQQAIEAYYHLQGHDGFANATDYKSATIAARAAKNSTVMFNSESDLPLQKYSNFAMEMAVLFKTDTQKELRQRFNSLYDNIQGVGGDVFNAAEKLSLVEAIKKHFNNIDYVSDGQTKRTDVAGDSKTSGKGRQEGAGEAASGERAETGGKPTDSGAGTNTDNKQSGKANPNLTQEREIAKAIQELSAKLNTPVVVYNSAEEIPEGRHKSKQAKAKAWYIPSTGEVFVNAFNATSVKDVRVSIFHEVVAHKGMRDMLGKEKHAELMNSIFDALPKQIQDALFEKYKSKEIAADEYVAYLAENEKNLTPQEKGTWESIKQAIIDFIENHIGINLTEQNVDDVIRGLLAESKSRLEGKQSAPIDIVEHARQTVEKAKPKEVSISLPADATHNDIRDAYDAQKEKVAYFDVGDRVIRAERKYTYHKGGKVIKTQYLHIEWLSSKKENADVYKHWRENIDGTWTETIHVAHNNWIREQKKKDKPAEPIDIVKVAKETVEKHTKAEQRISEAQAELDKSIDEFMDAFNDLNSDNLGFADQSAEKQAKMLVAGTKVVANFTKVNVFKFADMVNKLAQRGIDISADLLTAIKKAYVSFIVENEVDNMDDMKTVREFKLTDIKKNIDGKEQGRNTKVIESEAESSLTTTNTLAGIAETVADNKQAAGEAREQVSEHLEKVEQQINEVDQKIKNLRLTDKSYDPNTVDHETPITALSKTVIKKDVHAYVNAIQKMTGLDFDTNKKGKKQIANINIAPAGGDVYFYLWSKSDPNIGVYVTIPYQETDSLDAYGYPTWDYRVPMDGSMIMRTVSKESKHEGHNMWLPANLTAEELAGNLLDAINSKLKENGKPQEVAQPTQEVKPKEKKQTLNDRKQNKPRKIDNKLKEQTLSIWGEDSSKENKSTTKQSTENATTEAKQQERGSENTDRSLGEKEQQEPGGLLGERVDRSSAGNIRTDQNRSAGVSTNTTNEKSRDVKKDAQPKRNTRNNRGERGVDYAPTSPKARFNANISAINTMRKLIESGKEATQKEIETLRKYSGWGGLGTYFNNTGSENTILRSTLDSTEYDEATKSINSAYFTPTPVIDVLWDVVEKLGFKGGNILESSAGIGSILSVIPENINHNSNIEGVEIDPISGNILKLLYPDANIQVKGFEETNIKNGSVDLAITNVPFVTGLSVFDKVDKDLSRKFKDIHDYFIAKNIRKLRAGGIGVFITSSGTLDKSKSLKEWITAQGRADVIGAFRLNNETFGGTKATSDIIIVRKRAGSKPASNAINIQNTEIVRSGEYKTGETYWDRKKGGIVEETKTAALEYNSYFVQNPQHMGGEMAIAFEKGETYRPSSIGLYPKRGLDQLSALNEWAKSIDKLEDIQATPTETIGDLERTEAREGTLVMNKDGELSAARQGELVPLGVNKNKVRGHEKVDVLNDYNAIKQAIDIVLEYQLQTEDNAGLKPLIKELNDAYDTFVDKYGNLNKNVAISFLRNDVDYPTIAALEDYSETVAMDGKRTGVYKKTAVFKDRVIGFKSDPAPTNVKDAVIASMYVNGGVDIAYMAEKLNMSEEQVKADVLKDNMGFVDPSTGNVEVRYEYLSGNVRQKLQLAKDSNTDGDYNQNIAELEKVIPMDIPAHLIEFSLGSSWMHPKVYTDFIYEKYGVRTSLHHSGGAWIMEDGSGVYNEKNKLGGVRSEIVGKAFTAHQLVGAALNNRTVVFSKSVRNYDGTTETIYDKEASQTAVSRIGEIKDEFKEWAREKMLKDDALAQDVAKTYNEKFNAIVPKKIDEMFLPDKFDGAATDITLYPHQKQAVVRATTEPLMLAHEVGTGKSFTLISIAMEMRRLGTAKKPMIVVQNATVGQFVSETKRLYPNAKVLTLSDKDRTAQGRREFYGKIKFSDWDVIIVPQSTFNMIPDSEARQELFIREKIEDKMHSIESMRDANVDSNEIKRAEKELEDLNDELLGVGKYAKKEKKGDAKRTAKAKNNAAVQAKEQLDRRTDDVQNFDDLGVDAILIDEAHEYKRLGFATTMTRGVKGVDPSRSKRAGSMYLKSRAVLEKSGGKNVVFATGTPISNTAAEIWTFMKYLIPKEKMMENEIYYFDDFVRNFGKIEQTLEFTTSGQFKENTRFGAYMNVPELIRIWGSASDTVLTKDVDYVNDKVPDMESGKAQDIFLPQSNSLITIMKAVKAKLKEFEQMTGKQKKENSHIPLVMYGIAKRAAIDARLVDKNAADDPQSKTNRAIEETLKTLKETDSYKGTIAIFSESQNRRENNVVTFNLFEDIKEKLIKEGVPENQIMIMESGMTMAKKERVFSDVNDGNIRVVIGNTATLGTGVNIQERLHTLIHMDAPQRPMDYTQRNGRILRQGNMHKPWGKDVRVLRFGVEDSLDVTAYQMLKTKSSFIDSVMDGETALSNNQINRILEESDEGLFDNPVAVLSGSQYALLKNKAERELRGLLSRKNQHESDQVYINNRLRSNEGKIKANSSLVAEKKESLKKIQQHFPEGKAKVMTIEGKKVESEADIEAAFRDIVNKPINKKIEAARKNAYHRDEVHTVRMDIDGVDFNVHVNIRRESVYNQREGASQIIMRRDVSYTSNKLGIDNTPVFGVYAKGAFTEIVDNVITGKDYTDSIEALGNSIQRMEADNATMSERKGAPFDKEAELEAARKQVKEYTELMRKELEEKEAKYAEREKEAGEAEINEGVDEEVEADDDISYRDGIDEDIRYRETDRPQFSDAIETVVDRFVDRVTLKENEFQKEVPNLKKLVLFNDVKDYGLYDKYEVVPVSNPVINIHNLNNSIYGLGVELKPLNDLHSQALLNFDGDTGHLNQEKVKEFSNKFEGAIQPYETALLKTKHFATEVAQREIMDIIKDIDHAKDYYARLAKDHDVLRSEDAPRYREAWHGSPHEFDRFSLDHIGTGEGAQVFGWGLYFSDKEDIARSYAQMYKNRPQLTIDGVVTSPLDIGTGYWYAPEDYATGDEMKARVIKGLQENIDNLTSLIEAYEGKDGDWRDFIANKKSGILRVQEKIDKIRAQEWVLIRPSSNLYKVKIHGDKTLEEMNFLRWDKEIDKKAFNEIIWSQAEKEGIAVEWKQHRVIDKGNATFFLNNEKETGEQVYRALQRTLGSDKEASEFLLRAGIDGIQYPTQITSRGTHEDSFNFVVFDDASIEIEEAIRFRDAESISELADMVGSNMTEEARNEYDKKYKKFSSRFREAWEDSYLPVKQFQDLLEKNGLTIEEHNDYYKQATHVPGKNDFQLEHYKKTYQHPITLAVNALQEIGFAYREIENYVFAKHGIERNEFMRRDEAKNYANAIRQRAEIKAMQEQRSIDNKLSNGNIDVSEHEKQTNRIERAKQKKLKESDAVEERKYQELQDKDYAGLTQLMEEINPEGVDQGRTLQEMAEEYNKDFEGKAGEKLINSLWGKIKKATDFTLDNHYKTGGVSRDVYLELKGRYQNFVPLRGHDQEVAEDRWHYTQGNMGEFYSGAIIKAQGRRSRAESPFAYIGQMAHSSIMRGNKNALNQTLLRLAHKDKSGLMDVKRTWYVNKGTLENPMWEAEAAEFSDNIDTYLQNQIDFEERMKEMQEIGMAAQSSKHLNIGGLFIKPKQAEQHEIQVDQNGVHYTIYINANPAIARAVNGDNKKSIAKDMGFIGNVTRAMAMNFTTRNPLFIARNFSRDYIFANTMLMVKEDATYTARFNKNIPLAFAALTRQQRGNLDLKNETDLHLYEFMMNGGRTGFSHIFELKRAAKALEREAKKGDSKSALDYGRVALGAIDVVNDVVENATRFSTYMASRQAGRSITQSVHDAKNVTVNFNQKGAGSSIGKNKFEQFAFSAAGWVRPLYLFTNAAVQALSNVGKATKKHPVKMGTAITSFALMGFLSPIIAGMIGGDDEEDDFMKMADWDRQNNWCIPVGSGYIKIPLPHEMRVFHRLGDNIYQASTGRKDVLETTLDMVFALSDLLPMNPMGAADASWAELTPDFMKPYTQHITNTSFMGTRIHNQWANPYAPGYTKVSTNKKGEAYAPAFLIELYKHLDHITGGDGVKKGVISLNPDVTNHYMRGWFGGLWTIAEQSIDIGYKATEWSKTGELNLKVRETPISSFYTHKNDLNVSSGSTGQRYYGITKDVNEARRRSKGYVKKVREGEMSIHELTKKMQELDMPKVNALYERVKEVKAMEARLKDVDGKEQKDLEKEIFEKKKMIVEMK